MVRASGWKPEGRWFNSNFRQMGVLFLVFYIMHRSWFDICTTLLGLDFYIFFIYVILYITTYEYQDYSDHHSLNEIYVWPDKFLFETTFYKVFYINLKKNFRILYMNIYYKLNNNSFLKIFYKLSFKWSPIFKKTSYFGLFISSKNK